MEQCAGDEFLHRRETHDVSPAAASARDGPKAADGAAKPTPVSQPETRRSFEYPLEDYVGVDWGREIQWASPVAAGIPARKRSRARSFNHGAAVAETAWGETRTVSYAIDSCGGVSLRRTALGWESVERDALCREIGKETNYGRREGFTWDGFNRMRSDIVVSVQPDGSIKPEGSTRYDYNLASATGDPARVEIKDGGGPETLAKTYLDPFGRPWKQVVCERKASATDSWTHNLDEAYVCVDDASKIVTTITLYDALSGLEAFRSLPFSASEGAAILGGAATYSGLTPTVQLTGVAGARSQYERFGRLLEQTTPDGRVFSHSYDLGRETTVGDGVTVDLEKRGVEATLLRNGAITQSTRVNACDEQVAITDALGKTSTYSYDSFGRRVATGAPETEVWESCEGPSSRKIATERVSYSDNDEVLTITDALGKVTTKRYDEYGRVIEIVGPDGVTQETRVYDDAYDPRKFPDPPGGSKEPKPAPQRPRSVATSDAMGNSYTVWIDALDRAFRQRAPDGSQSATEYDARGREWRRISPTGEIVTMTYDWLDRAVAVEVELRRIESRGDARL